MLRRLLRDQFLNLLASIGAVSVVVAALLFLWAY
jgi:hypothetical protein